MRFEEDSPTPELVKTVPHIAFEVDDLNETIKGKNILIEPNSPSPGVMVVFIVDNDAPVEFLQIDRSIASILLCSNYVCRLTVLRINNRLKKLVSDSMKN